GTEGHVHGGEFVGGSEAGAPWTGFRGCGSAFDEHFLGRFETKDSARSALLRSPRTSVGGTLLSSFVERAHFFARLPHTRIEHQRRDAFLEESQKTQAQSCAGQRRTRAQPPRTDAVKYAAAIRPRASENDPLSSASRSGPAASVP